jgi:hypothetical protein
VPCICSLIKLTKPLNTPQVCNLHLLVRSTWGHVTANKNSSKWLRILWPTNPLVT